MLQRGVTVKRNGMVQYARTLRSERWHACTSTVANGHEIELCTVSRRFERTMKRSYYRTERKLFLLAATVLLCSYMHFPRSLYHHIQYRLQAALHSLTHNVERVLQDLSTDSRAQVLVTMNTCCVCASDTSIVALYTDAWACACANA